MLWGHPNKVKKGATRGIQGFLPSLGLHTELPSTPSRRELTLIHRLPSTLHEMDSYVIRNYTLLEINGDRLRWEV